jgi:hypothetical protein
VGDGRQLQPWDYFTFAVIRPESGSRCLTDYVPPQMQRVDTSGHAHLVAIPCLNRGSVLGLQRCFVATVSRAPAASAVMFAAVTAGVRSAAVRVRSAETLPAAVVALRRMAAAAHVEAA